MAFRGNEFKKLPPLDFPFVDGLCTVYKKDFIVLVSSGNKRGAYIADEKVRDLTTVRLYYSVLMRAQIWLIFWQNCRSAFWSEVVGTLIPGKRNTKWSMGRTTNSNT